MCYKGANTQDMVYSNIKLSYRLRKLLHLGQSDHVSMLLIPVYTPLRTSALSFWISGTVAVYKNCIGVDQTLDILCHCGKNTCKSTPTGSKLKQGEGLASVSAQREGLCLQVEWSYTLLPGQPEKRHPSSLGWLQDEEWTVSKLTSPLADWMTNSHYH